MIYIGIFFLFFFCSEVPSPLGTHLILLKVDKFKLKVNNNCTNKKIY